MEEILLINPRTSLNIENNEPLNLLSLAAYLTRQKLAVSIHDEIRPLASLEEKLGKVRYVGITANTCSYPRAVELAREIKARAPGVLIVGGGVHVTTCPEQALKDGFDLVVAGEGERALVDIVTKGEKEGIFSGTPIEDSELVRPDRRLIDMEFYSRTKFRCPHDPNLNFVPERQKVACYLTSRGCPYRCIFCHNIWRKTKLRFVPLDLVMEELRHLRRELGIPNIWLMDDHIFLVKKRAVQLFERILEEKLDIRWASATRADAVTEEVLELAHRAGCRRLALGVESGSQRILDKLDKGQSVQKNLEAIRLCRKHGIRSLATIMIGNPDETPDDIRKTIDFIREARPDDLAVSILTPFPGTILWKQCEEQGRLPEVIDFSMFDYLRAPIRISDHFTQTELETLKRNMLIRFYLQPNQLSGLLRKMVTNPRSMYRKIVEYF